MCSNVPDMTGSPTRSQARAARTACPRVTAMITLWLPSAMVRQSGAGPRRPSVGGEHIMAPV